MTFWSVSVVRCILFHAFHMMDMFWYVKWYKSKRRFYFYAACAVKQNTSWSDTDYIITFLLWTAGSQSSFFLGLLSLLGRTSNPSQMKEGWKPMFPTIPKEIPTANIWTDRSTYFKLALIRFMLGQRAHHFQLVWACHKLVFGFGMDRH